MKVHILTHTVVDDDDPTEFYSMVAEHLDKLKELGVVQAVAIHHGDLPPANVLRGLGAAGPMGEAGLCKLVADSIARARALSS